MNYVIEDNINFVIQINGKKKALLEVKRDIDEKTILKKIQETGNETEKFLKDQKIKKTIFIPNKLINICAPIFIVFFHLCYQPVFFCHLCLY